VSELVCRVYYHTSTVCFKNVPHFIFLNNSDIHWLISITFGMQHSEETCSKCLYCNCVHIALSLWNTEVLFQQFTTCLFFQMSTIYMSKTFSGSDTCFCETWYSNRQYLLSRWTAATARHPKNCMWCLHLSAGQCTGSSCTSNSGAALSWDSWIHCFWYVATQLCEP